MRVITNTAITIDGKIATFRHDHVAIGSETDRRYMHVLRARADAVLVGGRTFRNWPLPLVPERKYIERLKQEGFPDTEHPPLEGRTWWNVVVTRGDVPAAREDPRMRRLFFSPRADLPGEVEVGEVTVQRVIEALRGRGVETLLVEAGGALIWEFLAAGVVDEMYVTICPRILGGKDAPTLVDGPGFTAPLDLRLARSFRYGDEMYQMYQILP